MLTGHARRRHGLSDPERYTPNPNFDNRFAPLFGSGAWNRQRSANIGFQLTGEYDRMGRAVMRLVDLDPDVIGFGQPIASLSPHASRPKRGHPKTSHSAGASPLPVPPGRHSVGRGHGGGHGGHFGGRGRRARGSYGPYGWLGLGAYSIAPCPDGTVMLPDGTCVSLWDLDVAGGGATLVGCCPDCMPQSSPVPMVVGQSVTDPNEGSYNTILGPGGSGTPLGPGAGGTGTVTSGNPTADALNLQWQALAQVVPTCSSNPNPQLSSSVAPDVASTFWLNDYADWQQFYAGVGTWSISQVTGDLQGWQAYANAWATWVAQNCPNAQLPANFPQASPTGLSATPLASIASLVPSMSTIGWAIAAVGVGAGLWLLWPVIGHAGLGKILWPF